MIKFALIGCGRISKNHFESISQIKEAEIITCCDILEERAVEASEKYKIKSYYTDF